MNALRTLASLRLTLLGMVSLTTGVLVSYRHAGAGPGWLTVPLGLLAVNLLAALLTNPRFRRHGALMVFHLGLLAVVLLAAVGELAMFQGRLEITEGQAFDPGAVTVSRRGPWHDPDGLGAVAFVQGPFEVHYTPGLVRGRTRSQVRIALPSGGTRPATIGDNTPLVLAGYRLYSTSNKGYSAVLTWLGEDGETLSGTVHFPSYPLWEWKQLRDWRTPGGTALALTLLPPSRAPTERAWVLDSRRARGRLRVHVEDRTQVLRPGESLSLPGGRIRLEDIRMWIGYELFYHPTLPWLFAAALVAVAGLAWHLWHTLWSSPLPRATTQRIHGQP